MLVLLKLRNRHNRFGHIIGLGAVTIFQTVSHLKKHNDHIGGIIYVNNNMKNRKIRFRVRGTNVIQMPTLNFGCSQRTWSFDNISSFYMMIQVLIIKIIIDTI